MSSPSPASVPTEEDVARAIYDALYHDRLSDAWMGEFEDGSDVGIDGKVNLLLAARAANDLFAPIVAEKEREIEHFAELAFDDLGKNPPTTWKARALAAEAALASAREALEHAESYLMSIGHGDGTDGARIRREIAVLRSQP